MNRTYIITCEHAGNYIPDEYTHLFSGKEEVLYSHKAMDFGALRLAKQFAYRAQLPAYYTMISRLLVEANRSPDNEELFSEYTKTLNEAGKKTILAQYYYPHRNQVEKLIAQELEKGNEVVQVAVHTFTPVLEGQVREAEVGILFDPDRPLEEAFAEAYRTEILRQNPGRKVLFNSPYPGTDDGFATWLRKKFPKEKYGGLELEVNQKFFLDGDEAVWEQLVQELSGAFLNIVNVRA